MYWGWTRGRLRERSSPKRKQRAQSTMEGILRLRGEARSTTWDPVST